MATTIFNCQGMLEERLPMNNLIVPKWFSKIYPHWIESLDLNKNKLLTAFDIHKTWMHLLSTQTGADIDTGKGQSLFGYVPINRTCVTADIPLHLCTCSRRRIISSDTVTVQQGWYF
jgi:hypothetical protein